MPNRLRYDWTGPHDVLRKDGDNVYVIRHNVTAVEIKANVNRLRLHERWSSDVESTSRDPSSAASERAAWKTRGVPQVGDLFVMHLQNPDVPFGVGKLLERREDGTLHFQWLSNARDNVRGTFRPGWLDTRSNCWTYKDAAPSGQARKFFRAFTDVDTSPTDDDENNPVTYTDDDDVVVHGFAIDSRGKLPLPVQRIIHSDPRVNWEMPS